MRRWDIFCRVIDNYGDIGTCWRLAQQLAEERHARVRLWVDRLDSFARLCSSVSIVAVQQRIGDVEICQWLPAFPEVEVAEVVIEAFACEIPETYVAAMARRAVAPIWINLEYLSAETWVEGCHGLKSPHPRWPLTKHFFFPGFTNQTGGLLRERGLLGSRAAFDLSAENEFWCRMKVPSHCDAELRVSLFSYDNAALPELLTRWTDGPETVRVFATPGATTQQMSAWFGAALSAGQTCERGALIVHALPFLSQPDYDRLLWACDVNFVRGEDSFVRAQWAGQPFVWQIYPQAEEAHQAKLEAFLRRFAAEMNDAEADAVRYFWRAWNGHGDIRRGWDDFLVHRSEMLRHGKVWSGQLDRQVDLANNLARFVRSI